ncbi:nSTAND1 domain-containing NTPase [Nonomuraea wenchangensis]
MTEPSEEQPSPQAWYVAGAETDPRGEGVRHTAHARDGARIYQAGRDQHFHYGDGKRPARRAEPAGGSPECPYPGLAPFGREHARWFFGRERLIADLLARLDGRLRTGGMQAVIAPSGTGKSSLLRAGLLTRLAGGALPGSAQWRYVLLTPTSTPLQTLKAVVENVSGHGRTRMAVIVDQFEELFTLCSDERERLAYIDLLDRLATPAVEHDRPAALVVLGLRADFYATSAGYARLRPALQDQPLLAGPMTEDELREAIVHPAADVGLDVEPGLVEILLRDLAGAHGEDGRGHEPGRLPLLAHALRVSWQNRHGQTLTVEGYRATGGLAHAIATTASQVYDSLEPTGRKAARLVFLRLVKVGDGTEDVRRRSSRAELLDTAEDLHSALAVVEAFTRARLMTAHDDSIEITHEALIRAWPRLRSWIDDDRAARITHQHLEETAATWGRTGHDPELLYRGTRLAGAHALGVDDLSSLARQFLAASYRRWRRGTRLRTATAAVMTVLTLVAAGAAVFAFGKQNEALVQRDLAVHNRIMAEADRLRDSDISLSAQLSLAAHRMQSTDETAARLLSTQQVPLSRRIAIDNNQAVLDVAFSSDGRTLASVSDKEAVLWDISAPFAPPSLGRKLTRAGAKVTGVAFGPDGRTLACAESEPLRIPDKNGSVVRGAITLWDLQSPSMPARRGDPLYSGDVIQSVVFSPDGRLLTGTGATGMWRLPPGADPVYQRLIGSDDMFDAVAFSPRGSLLAGAGSNQDGRPWLGLWDVSDLARPVLLLKITLPVSQADVINALAFSPDGSVLASTGFTSIQLWNVSGSSRLRPVGRPLTGHDDLLQSLAFSPDGRMLASGSTDQSVRLWN